MSLPIVGAVLNLGQGDEDGEEVTVLAVDLDEAIWTVWNRARPGLMMITMDENHNWFEVQATEKAIGSDEPPL